MFEVDLAGLMGLSNMVGKDGGGVKNGRVIMMPSLRLRKRRDMMSFR